MNATDIAGGAAFARTACSMLLARLREVPRALPLPDVLEHARRARRARGGSRVTRTGSSRSPRSRPARAAKDTGVYGGRNVVVPSSAISAPSASRDDAGREHAGGLALVVRGADRGVALDVLDRAQPRADRAMNVGDGRVAVQIDEVPGPRVVLGWHEPQRAGRRGCRSSAAGSTDCSATKPVSVAARAPASAPSARHAVSERWPRAAPTTA